MNRVNPVPMHLHPDLVEVPWTDDEKRLLMRDLLDHKPMFPKGQRYAQDVLLRHPMLERTDNAISTFMKRQMKKQYLSILGLMKLNPDMLTEEERAALSRLVCVTPRNSPYRQYNDAQMVLRTARADMQNNMHLWRVNNAPLRRALWNLIVGPQPHQAAHQDAIGVPQNEDLAVELENEDPVEELQNLDPVQELQNVDPVQELQNVDPVQEVQNLDPVQEMQYEDVLEEVANEDLALELQNEDPVEEMQIEDSDEEHQNEDLVQEQQNEDPFQEQHQIENPVQEQQNEDSDEELLFPELENEDPFQEQQQIENPVQEQQNEDLALELQNEDPDEEHQNEDLVQEQQNEDPVQEQQNEDSDEELESEDLFPELENEDPFLEQHQIENPVQEQQNEDLFQEQHQNEDPVQDLQNDHVVDDLQHQGGIDKVEILESEADEEVYTQLAACSPQSPIVDARMEETLERHYDSFMVTSRDAATSPIFKF